MIERLNIELDEKNKLLEKQNSELLDKNSELEKSFRMLDTMVHKEQITHTNVVQEHTDVDGAMQEQIQYLINDDLYELEEIHGEMDRIIIEILNSTEQVDANTIEELTNHFSKYASTLAMYNFFDQLGASMKEFSFVLGENPLPSDEESVRNIFMLLEGFLYVLSKWQKDLRIGDISSINALDASMISDMETIVNMWTQKEEDLSEESLDDIFDF